MNIPTKKNLDARIKIPLVRYRLQFKYQNKNNAESTNILRKQYLGSAWRGTFGNNLRKTVCVTRQPICDDCALLYSCPYPNIFENRTPPNSKKLTRYSHTPNPFVLEPQDENFDSCENSILLGITLIGSANQYIPYVVHSFQQVARLGITAERIRLRLVDVQTELPNYNNEREFSNHWQTIYGSNKPLSTVSPRTPPVPKITKNIRVVLISPLRLKAGGHLIVANCLTFRAFFSYLLRRLSLLSYFFCDTPLEVNFKELTEQSKSVDIQNSNLTWHDWARYSSRQKSTLHMGGLIGTFELRREEILPFWPYLWIGQWTHIGKGCTVGLGRYVVQPVKEVSDKNIYYEQENWCNPRPL